MSNLKNKDIFSLLIHLGVKEKFAKIYAPLITEACANNQIEKKAFIANACHETMMLQKTREIWGPTEDQKRYEFRKDLGNNQVGDGFKHRGRGIFHTTGKANYAETSYEMFKDRNVLLKNPEKLEEPKYAVQSAVIFWNKKKLSRYFDPIHGKIDRDASTEEEIAKYDLFRAGVKKINGGYNGLKERIELYNECVEFFA